MRERLHVFLLFNAEEETRIISKFYGYSNYVKEIWLPYVNFNTKMSHQFHNFQLFGLCMSSCYCPIICKDCDLTTWHAAVPYKIMGRQGFSEETRWQAASWPCACCCWHRLHAQADFIRKRSTQQGQIHGTVLCSGYELHVCIRT